MRKDGVVEERVLCPHCRILVSAHQFQRHVSRNCSVVRQKQTEASLPYFCKHAHAWNQQALDSVLVNPTSSSGSTVRGLPSVADAVHERLKAMEQDATYDWADVVYITDLIRRIESAVLAEQQVTFPLREQVADIEPAELKQRTAMPKLDNTGEHICGVYTPAQRPHVVIFKSCFMCEQVAVGSTTCNNARL